MVYDEFPAAKVEKEEDLAGGKKLNTQEVILFRPANS